MRLSCSRSKDDYIEFFQDTSDTFTRVDHSGGGVYWLSFLRSDAVCEMLYELSRMGYKIQFKGGEL